jgi:ribosomal protein S18 acetylase RimI-like enzyme
MTIEFRTLSRTEIGEAVRLWAACGLTRPWNDPEADAQRALDGPSSTIVASFFGGRLIGTAMCGWDGHRGWICYLGVDADFRRWGIGRKLIWHCEEWLGQLAAPKIHLVVRSDNDAASCFYEAIGYEEDSFRFFCRLIVTRHRNQ